MRLALLLSCFSLLSIFASSEVDINVYSTGDLYNSSEQVQKGLELFKKSLLRSCKIDFKYRLNIKRNTVENNIDFKNSYSHKDVNTIYGKEQMIFLQEPLLKYLDQNNLLKSKSGISIHYVNEVKGHCGYAFPEVQMEKIKSSKLKSYLSNNILISSSSMLCGRLSRLLSHELAHILIQDSPSHMCGNVECDEQNILSVYRKARPLPDFDRTYPRRGPPRGIFDSVTISDELPSDGLLFNSQQCEAVIKNLKNMK